MATTRDITNTDWSLSLAAPDAIVQGLDDIKQCIKIILGTRKGSDRLRPDFGSDHFKYLDKPVNASGPGVLAEIQTALTTYETRIKVTLVTAQIIEAQVIYTIAFKILNTVNTGQTDVTYGLSSS
jgi:phage baseplate assembly protein W